MTGIRRGLSKPTLEGRPHVLPRCAAVSVGSMPLVDPQAAVELVIDATPEAPAWPQLPRRSYLENMYAQFSEGMPGVVVDVQAERMFVLDQPPDEELIDFVERLEADDLEAFRISEDHAAAIPFFARAVGASSPAFIKGQITGPVSFGLAVPKEDRQALLYDDTLRDLATKLLAMKARWQEGLLRRWAPGATPLIMVDEPSLTQLGSAFVSIPLELCLPALEECLLALTCLSGIHVCGGTDWDAIARLPVDVLNFDAADYLDAVVTRAETVAAFVAEGGLIAWGAIPNDERVREWSAATAAARVVEGVKALAATGLVTETAVLQASFVSPSCGTGTMEPGLAERCLRLTAETSAWLRESFPEILAG